MKKIEQAVKRRSWGITLESWLPTMGALVILLIVATVLLWPAPVDPNQLFAARINSDLFISHWPTALLIQRTLAQQHALPLWNPFFGGGQPLAADPLAALFYPPTHLADILPLRDYYLVLIWGHLVWAGLGMLLLAYRAFGLPRVAALVAAVSYMATPRLLSHLGAGHITLVQTVTWYPWLALACWATVREPRRWWLALGVCIALTLLAGHPQMAYYGLLMMATLAVWLLVKGWRTTGWRSLLAPVAGLAAAGALGVLLAAIHLLPLLEFTAYSTRQQSLNSGDAYPLLSFLHALVFEPPPLGSTWEGFISPGLVVLLLAIVGVVAHWRKAWPLALGVVVVAGLAVGNSLPLYVVVLHTLPGFDLFRVIARIWFIALMLIALLAGLGVDALLNGTRRIIYRMAPRVSSRGIALGMKAAGCLAVVLVALSLVISDAGYARIGDVSTFSTPSALARTAAQLAGVGNIYGVQENIPQLSAVQLQARLADGWDPLLIKSYVSYMDRAGGYYATGYQLHIPYDSPSVQPNAKLLGLVNVSIVVSRRPLTDPHFALLETVEGTLIYRDTTDAGPAYLVNPGRDGNPPTLEQLQRLATNVRVVTLAPEQETFSFNSSTTAYLIIALPVFPGWIAELDGHPVAMQEFAGVLPAIKVGPGAHFLTYNYMPSSVRYGAILSLIGLLAAIAWIVANMYHKRRRSDSRKRQLTVLSNDHAH